MDINSLKLQTSVEHDRVENSMRVMDRHLDLKTYVHVLQSLYGFVLGWEQWAARSTSTTVQTLLCGRQRSKLLGEDLRFFSSDPFSGTYAGPDLLVSSQSHVLGGLYVMEGSTLGGQYIARHVEGILALTPGSGDSFFRGYGDATSRMWREVKEALTDLPDTETEDVICAARKLFQDCAQWNEGHFARRCPEAIRA